MTPDDAPHPGELLAAATANYAVCAAVRDATAAELRRLGPELDAAGLRTQATARIAQLRAEWPQLRRLEGHRAFRRWTRDLRRSFAPGRQEG